MKSDQSITAHDDTAADYDRRARECGWFGPEILLGLSSEYLHPPGRLIDIGIGTGLSSAPFARAGLEVHGFDASAAMLNVCRTKGIAVGLRQLDLREATFPYHDGFFDVAIACGVLHFFPDLEPILQETARVLRPGGILAFTVRAVSPEEARVPGSQEGVSTSCSQGVTIYGHEHGHVRRLAESQGFVLLRNLRFLVRSGSGGDDLVFAACVAQKDRW